MTAAVEKERTSRSSLKKIVNLETMQWKTGVHGIDMLFETPEICAFFLAISLDAAQTLEKS